MKKETKIRSPFIQSVIEEREKLGESIVETSKSYLHDILNETVKSELNNALNEGDENEYEEQEVDSTPSLEDYQDNAEGTDEIDNDGAADEGGEIEVSDEEEGIDGDDEQAWQEFEQYKEEDGTYNLTDADEETFKRIFNLLKDDDKLFVISNDGEGNVTMDVDGEGEPEGGEEEEDVEFAIDVEVPDTEEEEDILSGVDLEDEDEDDDIFEVILNDDENMNEADLGYTDNYQNKTAMTTPPNNGTERSWDKGAPTGNDKRWVGKKGDMSPFNESEECCDGECEIEEQKKGFVQRNTCSKTLDDSSSHPVARNGSVAGVKVKSTSEPRYSGDVVENIKRKANAIWEENKQLKNELTTIKEELQKAAVLNYNLAQITKLFTENTTSRDEKRNIVKRFSEEATTIAESKRLFASIENELKNVKVMENVNNMDKQLNESKTNQIVETPIYASEDVNESLNLMERMMLL